MNGTLYVAEGDTITAKVVDHAPSTDGGYEYPARTIAHVHIGDVNLVMDETQAVDPRDALASAIAAHAGGAS